MPMNTSYVTTIGTIEGVARRRSASYHYVMANDSPSGEDNSGFSMIR
jgi:hypothetical protein